MGEMIDLLTELRKENKEARTDDQRVFADALRVYYEAAENIKKNGAVCSHPRTGAPIEKPYLKILAQQGAEISRLRWIKSDRILKTFQDSLNQ